MLIGYARVSTADQDLEIQTDALVAAGVDMENIYSEHVSGAKTKRAQLDLAMKVCREGDTLVVVKLDRLARSLPHLIRIMERLDDKGVGFRSLTESIDTTTPIGNMLLHILGAVAQFERDLIIERTNAGLKKARERGKRGGRKRKLDDKKVRTIVAMLQDKTVTMGDIADAYGVSRPTIYRELRRMEDQEKAEEIRQLMKERDAEERERKKERAAKARESTE